MGKTRLGEAEAPTATSNKPSSRTRKAAAATTASASATPTASASATPIASATEQNASATEQNASATEQNASATEQNASASGTIGEANGITVKELKDIINNNKYQPHSYWRWFLSISLGRFWDSYKYSVPVYNLLELARDKNDSDNISSEQIHDALKKTSMFDFSYSTRTKNLGNPNFFSLNTNKEKLNTNDVIATVLQKFK